MIIGEGNLAESYLVTNVGRRVRGLDSLRIVLAMWVVFSHFGLPPLPISESTIVSHAFWGFYNNLFSGPAAVIVFFVISGFCIHYPFRLGKRLELVPYFARRHIRIWIPIIAAVALGAPVGVKMTTFQGSVLWSLLAEEIYYIIYPALLAGRRRLKGWRSILAISYVCAIAVILTDPGSGNYVSYGSAMIWLLGLPCWLLGCILAEHSDEMPAAVPGMNTIWSWRLGAWALSWLASALRFHSPIGYPWTLSLFALYAYAWLWREVEYHKDHAPSPMLEAFGKASYSVYLLHMIGIGAWEHFEMGLGWPLVDWWLRLAMTLALCTVFYFIVEKPSHLAARGLAEWISRRRAAAKVG